VDHLLWLEQPLGKWLQSPHQATHKWHWLTSYTTQKLYHWNGQWQIHARHRGYLNHNPKYWVSPSRTIETLPLDCQWVTIKHSGTYLSTTYGHGHIETMAETPATWQEHINQLPAKHKSIFQHLKLKEDGQPILQAISNRHVVAVSDRSFKESQGTAAWVFYDDCDLKTALGEGVMMTPGATWAQGLYQSKLAGIYGIVSTVNALLNFHWQEHGVILIVWNGESALNKSMKPWASNPLDKQFDIIQAIWARMHKTKLKWTSEHIKGHQDQEALALSDKARWNNAMDTVAKNHWEKYKRTQIQKYIACSMNHGSSG